MEKLSQLNAFSEGRKSPSKEERKQLYWQKQQQQKEERQQQLTALYLVGEPHPDKILPTNH